MGTVTIVFTLDRHHAVPAPDIRFWLDTDGSGVLSEAEEVVLSPPSGDGASWSGAKEVFLATAGMAFLVRYTASAGSRWTIDITSDAPATRQIFRESGLIKNVKGSIVGRMTS